MKIKRIGKIGLCILAMLVSLTTVFPVFAFTDSKQLNITRELEPNSIIVSNFEELSKALSEDNGITYIYLDADITESYGGIDIHPSKESVVIDGVAPGKTKPVTFSQETTGTDENIQVLSNNIKVEIKNLNIVSQNDYGFISANIDYTDNTIIFQDVEYKSLSEMVYNPNGTIKLINTNINIQPPDGDTAYGVSFSKDVILGGEISIYSDSLIVFNLLEGSTSFTVVEGANVNVETSGCFIYTDESYPTVTFEDNSSFIYIGGHEGFQYSTGQFNALTIKSGATVNVTQNQEDYNSGFFRIKSELLLENGSSLYLNRSSGGSAFEFTEAGASAVFNNPERVDLNVPSGEIVNFNGTGSLEINTETMNYWTTANDNDSIENMPKSLWNKVTGETLKIEATFEEDTMQTFTSNFVSGTDPTPTDLTTDTFNLSNCQMLVFGIFDLTVDKVTTSSTAITGVTEDDAALKITYPTQSGDLTVNGSAVGSNFAVAIDQRPVSDGEVSVLAHSNYLKRLAKKKVIENEGALILKSVPPVISFSEHQIPKEITLYERVYPDSMQVIIEDTRSEANSWSLYVSVQEPLTTTINGNKHTLTNALVYIKDSKETALTSDLFKVITHEGSYEIKWEQDEGILLRVKPWEIYSGEYHATIGWSLHDTP